MIRAHVFTLESGTVCLSISQNTTECQTSMVILHATPEEVQGWADSLKKEVWANKIIKARAPEVVEAEGAV